MKVLCPECGTGLKVPQEALGRKGRCPECKVTFRLRAPAREAKAGVASADDANRRYAMDGDGHAPPPNKASHVIPGPSGGDIYDLADE
jgi:predicted Zn finger-like uncharacterized protein